MGRKFQREGTGNGKELSCKPGALLVGFLAPHSKTIFFFDEKWNFHQHRFSF
jgi:hypothetical protein